jgi:DNA-binding response OmpR family regulator
MHILVIEDDQRVSNLIKRGLEENGFEVTQAFDGELGKKLALRNGFDLIISDIILPKISGTDLCREIRAQRKSLPIIMLTALGTTDDKVEGFDAGADDYLVKPFEMRELIARVQALLKRYKNNIFQTETTLSLADLEMNLETKEVKRNDITVKLTPKEFKLLEYLLINKKRVVSRVEIAQNVWDTHFDTGTNFIDVYINYLRKKVDKSYEVKLIHTISGMGFILSDTINN